ncbi:MAG: hypothetical protein KDB06_13980 [Ilumatobacter sp.]|nr:hypothetical protein [Ilumatobacter sp.]
MTPTEAGLVFVTPEAYADPQLFHEACAVLRREDPIHLVEHPDFPPFHVLTKHADVLEVELHNKEWENAPRPVIATLEADQRREEQGDLLRTLIHMDDPDHRTYRGLASDWFLPKNLALLEVAWPTWHACPPSGWWTSGARATSPATSPCSTRCR